MRTAFSWCSLFHSDSQRSKLFVLRLFQTRLCCPIMTELVVHHAATIGAAFGQWCVHAPRLNSQTVHNFWTVDAASLDYLEGPWQSAATSSGVLLRENYGARGASAGALHFALFQGSKDLPEICHSGYVANKCKSYQLYINYISTIYQLYINYISTIYQLYINYNHFLIVAMVFISAHLVGGSLLRIRAPLSRPVEVSAALAEKLRAMGFLVRSAEDQTLSGMKARHWHGIGTAWF